MDRIVDGHCDTRFMQECFNLVDQAEWPQMSISYQEDTAHPEPLRLVANLLGGTNAKPNRDCLHHNDRLKW